MGSASCSSSAARRPRSRSTSASRSSARWPRRGRSVPPLGKLLVDHGFMDADPRGDRQALRTERARVHELQPAVQRGGRPVGKTYKCRSCGGIMVTREMLRTSSRPTPPSATRAGRRGQALNRRPCLHRATSRAAARSRSDPASSKSPDWAGRSTLRLHDHGRLPAGHVGGRPPGEGAGDREDLILDIGIISMIAGIIAPRSTTSSVSDPDGTPTASSTWGRHVLVGGLLLGWIPSPSVLAFRRAGSRLFSWQNGSCC